ncbi:MAG: ATP-binding protein [Chitinophagales bacterium]
MALELILAIFLFRVLRKSLNTAELTAKWDRILLIGATVSIVLLPVNFIVSESRWIITWMSYALLLVPVYLVFFQEEFRSARGMINTVLPFIVVSFCNDLAIAIDKDFHNEWESYFKSAVTFSIIWALAMWLITRNQRIALEKETLKTKEKEEQNKITETLKAALEVQVAERTMEITLQKEELLQTLNDLKATQSQLIQSEKMASLGELTAGIAHEIQNPLNFVNNFSEVNTELIEEMKTEIMSGNLELVKSIANDITTNEQKINYHGKRAEAIVKGMLLHSRISSGTKEPTDINALADEYLRLAYHGLRAKDKSFNATMKTDFDENIGNINIISQDMGRVILNLITNAFYAVTEKKRQQPDAYEPTVSVSTKKINARQDDPVGLAKVEIKVKDNGNGIPKKVLDKIFQPFFTTKPTGQGTGLGLSLSYDIVKAHGGELKVETKENEGAEFIIQLPVV